MNNFIKSTFQADFAEDIDKELAHKLFIFTSVSVCISTALVAAIYMVLNINQVALIQIITSSLSATAILIYYRTKSLELPVQIILTWVFLTTIYRNMKMGGIDSPTMYTIFLIPLYTGVLLSYRFSLFWTSLFILSAVSFYILPMFGFDFEPSYSSEALNSAKMYTLVISNIICLNIIFSIKHFFSRARKLLTKEKDEKSHLLKIITHDIASPITNLNFLLLQLKTKENAETCDKAIRALNSISTMVKDIKNYEAIKAGKQVLVKRAVSWGQIFEELSFLNSDGLSKKRIKFIYPVEMSSEMVYTDQNILVYQILNNLLSNAIKFSSMDSEVRIELTKYDDHFILKLIDTGIGIPKEMQQELFNPNYKTSRHGTMGERGTGFGLPIVKNFTDLLHGEISIQSTCIKDNSSDHGTVVTLKIPLQ